MADQQLLETGSQIGVAGHRAGNLVKTGVGRCPHRIVTATQGCLKLGFCVLQPAKRHRSHIFSGPPQNRTTDHPGGRKEVVPFLGVISVWRVPTLSRISRWPSLAN